MLKQTIQTVTDNIETIERVGAGALAGLAMLVSVEMVLEHSGEHHDLARAKVGHGISEVLARAETKGETARLPEEYDVGLQTPDIAGL